jgi:ribonuclease HI
MSTCTICGTDEEDSFHATVACTKAKALREHWNLPPESMFQYTGKDWLLILLSSSSQRQRIQSLLLLWRAWHLRCDIIHGKGEETIRNSANFLLNYEATFAEPLSTVMDDKGKKPLTNDLTNAPFCSDEKRREKNVRRYVSSSWTPPPEGTIKINVDAAFHKQSGEAAIGMVARDHQVAVVAALSRPIGSCQDVEEAEARAILAGLQLGMDRNMALYQVASDSTLAVADVNSTTTVCSRSWNIYKDIKQALSVLPDCSVVYTSRKHNLGAHELAKLASRSQVCNLWLPPLPEVVYELALRDDVNCMTK